MSKKKKELGPIGCLLAIIFFPILVIWELMKEYAGKPKRRKTGGRGHGKRDYWPYN